MRGAKYEHVVARKPPPGDEPETFGAANAAQHRAGLIIADRTVRARAGVKQDHLVIQALTRERLPDARSTFDQKPRHTCGCERFRHVGQP